MYYGGLDLHTQYVTVAILDAEGAVVLETSVPTSDPQQVVSTLAPFRPLTVALEACGLWPWLNDTLESSGVAVTLAHPKQVRAIATAPHKNDPKDARLLARMLQAQLLPPAYSKTPEQRERARLVRHHTALVRLRTQLANRIHGQLHQANVTLPRERLLRAATRPWLETEVAPTLTCEQQAILATHLVLIDAIAQTLRPLHRRIIVSAQADATAQLLQTVPGIGPFWALLLTAEVTPLGRFPTAAHLVAYAGLAPRTRSSGGRTRHGGIPSDANRWVRWALVSAVPAHVAAAPASPLSVFYTTQKERLGWRTARVATARKLTRILFHILRTKTPWSSDAMARPRTESCRVDDHPNL